MVAGESRQDAGATLLDVAEWLLPGLLQEFVGVADWDREIGAAETL